MDTRLLDSPALIALISVLVGGIAASLFISVVRASEEVRYRLDLWDILVFITGLAAGSTLALAVSLGGGVAGVAGLAGGLGALRLRRTFARRPAALKYDHVPSTPASTLPAMLLIGVGIALALLGAVVTAFMAMLFVTSKIRIALSHLLVLGPVALTVLGIFLIRLGARAGHHRIHDPKTRTK